MFLCVTLNSVCVYVNTGLDPSHMAILGCPTQVFREGRDRDVTGKLMSFHCAHLVNGEERKHDSNKLEMTTKHHTQYEITLN